MAGQFTDWLVCQKCGRATPKEVSDGWLAALHKDRWDVLVIRCPQHWTDHALRSTRAGRTREMRDRMKESLAMPAPSIPVSLQPFPITDREEAEDDGEQAQAP